MLWPCVHNYQAQKNRSSCRKAFLKADFLAIFPQTLHFARYPHSNHSVALGGQSHKILPASSASYLMQQGSEQGRSSGVPHHGLGGSQQHASPQRDPQLHPFPLPRRRLRFVARHHPLYGTLAGAGPLPPSPTSLNQLSLNTITQNHTLLRKDVLNELNRLNISYA